jgi:superfamily II DNA helicase RecQ
LSRNLRASRFLDRPNIRYSVQPKTDPKKQLAKFLEHHTAEAGI